MTSPLQHSPDPNKLDPNVLASIYQSLTARRAGYEMLLWQVPALSLTAQAFLFTIARHIACLLQKGGHREERYVWCVRTACRVMGT